MLKLANVFFSMHNAVADWNQPHQYISSDHSNGCMAKLQTTTFSLWQKINKKIQQAQPQPFLWQEQLTLYHPQRNIIHFITLRQFSNWNNNHVISSSLGQLSQSETTHEYHFKTISLSQTSSVSLSENVLWQKQPKVRVFSFWNNTRRIISDRKNPYQFKTILFGRWNLQCHLQAFFFGRKNLKSLEHIFFKEIICIIATLTLICKSILTEEIQTFTKKMVLQCFKEHLNNLR